MECVLPPVNITQTKLVLLDTHNSLHKMLNTHAYATNTHKIVWSSQLLIDILILYTLLLISKPYHNIINNCAPLDEAST